ncbi:MAG: hypothetical protein C4336_07120 [Armatimonadota bacterium]
MRLIGVLVSMAILAGLLLVWLYYGTGGSPSCSSGSAPPVSRVSEVKQSAHSVECRNNLSQIRQAIQIRMTTEATPPPNLNGLGLPQSMLICPVSGQPYQFNSATGQVRCTTPEHMSY